MVNKNDSLEDLKTIVFNKFQKALIAQLKNELNSINIYYPHGFLKTKDAKCPHCQKNYSKAIFCCLNETLDKYTTIEKIMEKQEKDKPLILYAKSDVYEERKYIYKGMELFFEKNNDIETKEVISLYDSLDYFSIPTNSDKKFFCKHCVEQRNFKRQLQLYTLPIYLIIQIKRGKNDKFIEYKETFELKDYIIGPNKEDSTYELYSVILHKKSLNSSSYSCFCKNFGLWIYYNYNELERINTPINKDAYILFYKRRNID